MLDARCSAIAYAKGITSNLLVIARATDLVVSLRNYALDLHSPAIVKDLAFARAFAIRATLELYLITLSFSLV
jgi:hypothetical protein